MLPVQADVWLSRSRARHGATLRPLGATGNSPGTVAWSGVSSSKGGKISSCGTCDPQVGPSWPENRAQGWRCSVRIGQSCSSSTTFAAPQHQTQMCAGVAFRALPWECCLLCERRESTDGSQAILAASQRRPQDEMLSPPVGTGVFRKPGSSGNVDLFREDWSQGFPAASLCAQRGTEHFHGKKPESCSLPYVFFHRNTFGGTVSNSGLPLSSF